MSFGELLLLAFLALMIFGPKKLPEIARTIAKAMAELRRAGNEFRYSLEDEMRSLEIREQEARRASAPAALPPTSGSIAQPRSMAPTPLPPGEPPTPPAGDESGSAATATAADAEPVIMTPLPAAPSHGAEGGTAPL